MVFPCFYCKWDLYQNPKINHRSLSQSFTVKLWCKHLLLNTFSLKSKKAILTASDMAHLVLNSNDFLHPSCYRELVTISVTVSTPLGPL